MILAVRLVAWNCCQDLAHKTGALIDLAPDVAVLSESSELLQWPSSCESALSYVFHGANRAKGIAVVGFGDTSLERAEHRPGIDWVLPVRVDGPRSFLLLAVWTVVRRGSPSYSRQVELAIDAYEPLIRAGEVVLAGDFNCATRVGRASRHERNVARLADLGMVSAYHAFHGLDHGVEPTGTLYWRWKLDAPFHCDFVFVPQSWTPALTAVTVGDADEWVGGRLSDHCPVIVDCS